MEFYAHQAWRAYRPNKKLQKNFALLTFSRKSAYLHFYQQIWQTIALSKQHLNGGIYKINFHCSLLPSNANINYSNQSHNFLSFLAFCSWFPIHHKWLCLWTLISSFQRQLYLQTLIRQNLSIRFYKSLEISRRPNSTVPRLFDNWFTEQLDQRFCREIFVVSFERAREWISLLSRGLWSQILQCWTSQSADHSRFNRSSIESLD